MNVITLKLPDDLHAAPKEVSAKRKLSKSAVVREALEQLPKMQVDAAAASRRWVAQWRGRLDPATKTTDPRLLRQVKNEYSGLGIERGCVLVHHQHLRGLQAHLPM